MRPFQAEGPLLVAVLLAAGFAGCGTPGGAQTCGTISLEWSQPEAYAALAAAPPQEGKVATPVGSPAVDVALAGLAAGPAGLVEVAYQNESEPAESAAVRHPTLAAEGPLVLQVSEPSGTSIDRALGTARLLLHALLPSEPTDRFDAELRANWTSASAGAGNVLVSVPFDGNVSWDRAIRDVFANATTRASGTLAYASAGPWRATLQRSAMVLSEPSVRVTVPPDGRLSAWVSTAPDTPLAQVEARVNQTLARFGLPPSGFADASTATTIC